MRDDDEWDKLIASLDFERLFKEGWPKAEQKFEEIDRPEGPGETIIEGPQGVIDIEQTWRH